MAQGRCLEASGAVYDELELPFPGDPSRPYVLLNMVSSVDGVCSVGGKASGIGGGADRRAMRALRSRVDAVMVGAGTLRAERLNLGLDDPRAEQPLAVIIAGRGPVPIRNRLIRGPGSSQRVIVFRPDKPQSGEPHSGDEKIEETLPERVRTIRVPKVPKPSDGQSDGQSDGRADLRRCLEILRREIGVDRLLVEGGPSLNGALIEAGLVDELFLTIAPRLMNADPAPIVHPGHPEAQSLQLISARTQNGELFLRYGLKK